MSPLSLAGFMTIAASIAAGATLAFVRGGAGPLGVAGAGAVLGVVLVVMGRRGAAGAEAEGGAAGPAPEPDRFKAAFAKTQAGSPKAQPTSDVGASTLAVKFVPDSSVAPMPGFTDVYQKIAAGSIGGHLMVVGGPDRGRGLELAGNVRVTVGRGANHTLRLADAGASNDQCMFLAENGRVTVEDLGSKNGTHVNNQRIDKRQILENCDIVAFGATKILATLPG